MLRNILVIVFEALSRRIFERMLRRSGYWPTIVSSESDALDVLERTMFDVMIVDTDTPGLGSAQLVKLVRMARLGDRPLPVIALTIDGGDSLSRQLKELGLEAILTKPVPPEKLHSALKMVSETQASSPGR